MAFSTYLTVDLVQPLTIISSFFPQILNKCSGNCRYIRARDERGKPKILARLSSPEKDIVYSHQ